MATAIQLYFPTMGVACAVRNCQNPPVILAFPGGVPVCVVHEEQVRHRYARDGEPIWRLMLEGIDV